MWKRRRGRGYIWCGCDEMLERRPKGRVTVMSLEGKDSQRAILPTSGNSKAPPICVRRRCRIWEEVMPKGSRPSTAGARLVAESGGWMDRVVASGTSDLAGAVLAAASSLSAFLRRPSFTPRHREKRRIPSVPITNSLSHCRLSPARMLHHPDRTQSASQLPRQRISKSFPFSDPHSPLVHSHLRFILTSSS